MSRAGRCAWLLVVAAAGAVAGASEIDFGRADFPARREPPPVRALDAASREQFELGQLVFNTSWLPAGTPRAARRDGIGPLFNGSSCDACHNNGARGRAAARDGVVPGSFVIQLGGAPSLYGHVFNTSALPGTPPEGVVEIATDTHSGRYADGTAWSLRSPRYTLTSLGYGALDSNLIIRPRIGPALFGVGLLEGVPSSAIQAVRREQPRRQRGAIGAGRFGWQAEATSITDQTERALQREMGLTTSARPSDDCSAAQRECRSAAGGSEPEVSAEFLTALVAFQRELAVPRAEAADPAGEALFSRTGCAICHRPVLPAHTSAGDAVIIRPFTDLLTHDLGDGLADRRVDGRAVRSRWRTAPLWGLSHALLRPPVALMHDGRARSVEEAILWHGGQAAEVRDRFLELPAAERALLIGFVSTR